MNGPMDDMIEALTTAHEHMSRHGSYDKNCGECVRLCQRITASYKTEPVPVTLDAGKEPDHD